MPPKKFQYQESFIELGFSVINDKGTLKPQCVLCHEVLFESSLKPSKLSRHLKTKHTSYEGKDVDFFKEKKMFIRCTLR